MSVQTTWTVPATVVKVHDGDTITADLDLGWNITLRASIRIDGLAAPELSTAAGKASRDYAQQLLPVGSAISVVSKKLLGSREKFGRVLASVSFTPPTAPRDVLGDFATAMVTAGKAVAWDGTGKQPAG